MMYSYISSYSWPGPQNEKQCLMVVFKNTVRQIGVFFFVCFFYRISFFLNEVFFCCQSLNKICNRKKKKKIFSSYIIRVNICIIWRAAFYTACYTNTVQYKMPRWLIKPIGTGGAMSEEIHRQKMQTTECITYLQFSPMLPGTKCIFDRKRTKRHTFWQCEQADAGQTRRIRKHTSRGKVRCQEELRHKAGVRVRPAELQPGLKVNVKTLI